MSVIQNPPGTSLPSQTSHSGEYLTTNGTTASWGAVSQLPTQTSHAGEVLTTNGTTASWVTSPDWSTVNATWTSASATTITVPTDATTRYSVGTRLRLKQGGAFKYFVIVGVTATLLTITGGTDYTLANAAITDIGISFYVNPIGYPEWFNYAPTFTGFSADPTGGLFIFSVNGHTVKVRFTSGTGTSNATTFTISLPLAAKTLVGLAYRSFGAGMDNTAVYQASVLGSIGSAGTTINLTTGGGATAWTASGTKSANLQAVEYEYA